MRQENKKTKQHKRHKKLNVVSFHELMLKAYRQGLTPAFTDSDVCQADIDLWPDDTDEVKNDGAPVTLFDTHYSDKIGPSEGNELICLGTVDEPADVKIKAVIVDNLVQRIEIDKGPGMGKATITFVSTAPAGIKLEEK